MGQDVAHARSRSAPRSSSTARGCSCCSCVAVLPSFLGETHFAALEYSLLFRWTPERRQLDYLRYVGASDETAKEVQMFGLAPLARSSATACSPTGSTRRTAARRSGKRSSARALSLLGTLGYYARVRRDPAARAIAGAITIGTLTFLAGVVPRSRDLDSAAAAVGERHLRAEPLPEGPVRLLRDEADDHDAQPARRRCRGRSGRASCSRTSAFAIREASDGRCGTSSFALRPGERVALVGENGAGKTTLTKLLRAPVRSDAKGASCSTASISASTTSRSCAHAIGVIFQDFVRYDMRFDENIGVGEIERVRDYLDARTVDGDERARAERELASAAEKSLAASLLPRFAGGYRQMLGRRFEGGVDLSGGEWQKIALARAYMRDAQLLILDEPTAALDARAEYEVFMRFSELMAGRMAVLISHRFSTVRMADRIIVLQNGGIVEQGTHEELVAPRRTVRGAVHDAGGGVPVVSEL